MDTEFFITSCGMTGRIFRTHPTKDQWSFQLGGYYHWNMPLNRIAPEAERVMIAAASRRVANEFKKTRRIINKQIKQDTNDTGN